MDRGAKFSDCGKYRYFLFRRWDKDRPIAMCIGLNPSTATAEDDDPTIRNLVDLLGGTGYGGFYMCNLYGLISSDPERLRDTPDPMGDNAEYLDEIGGIVDEVFFCWGSFKHAEWRAKKVVEQFPNALCFGKTPTGKP
jgi:hypothetical protein